MANYGVWLAVLVVTSLDRLAGGKKRECSNGTSVATHIIPPKAEDGLSSPVGHFWSCQLKLTDQLMEDEWQFLLLFGVRGTEEGSMFGSHT